MSIFVALLASQYPSGRDGEVLPRKSRDMPIPLTQHDPLCMHERAGSSCCPGPNAGCVVAYELQERLR